MLVAVIGGGLWFGGRTLFFYLGPSETLLSQTGYQRHPANHDGVDRFAPQYPFWSDGAVKHRSIHIPAGSKIDTANLDRWNFPMGTRIWKDFERDGVLIETRMLLKSGDQPGQWDMATYMWRDDYSDADKLMLGKRNVRGTDHDIPSPSQCTSCHSAGKQKRALGVNAIQLPWDHAELLSISTLIKENRLSVPIRSPFEIPGDPLTKRALGYLDTNCGSCHYDGSTFVAATIPLRLNLTTDTLSSVSTTNAFRTTINRPPHLEGMNTQVYVKPGDPEASFLYRRLSIRDGGIWQMPPIATEKIDAEGAELIHTWIESLIDE